MTQVLTEVAKLTASDASMHDHFGRKVALSGDTAIVGASFEDHAGLTDPGAAYVFVHRRTGWFQQAKLVATDAADLDLFGTSVALSKNTAVVGAYRDDNGDVRRRIGQPPLRHEGEGEAGEQQRRPQSPREVASGRGHGRVLRGTGGGDPARDIVSGGTVSRTRPSRALVGPCDRPVRPGPLCPSRMSTGVRRVWGLPAEPGALCYGRCGDAGTGVVTGMMRATASRKLQGRRDGRMPAVGMLALCLAACSGPARRADPLPAPAEAPVVEAADEAGAAGVDDDLPAATRLNASAEAEALLRESADFHRAAYGRDHAWTAIPIVNLATLLDRTGRLAEAQPLWEEALGIRTRALGEGDAETLVVLENLGWCRIGLGDTAGAVDAFTRLLEAHADRDRPPTRGAMSARLALAEARRAAGQAPEAQALFNECIPYYIDRADEGDVDATIALNNYGWFQLDRGRVDIARNYFARALEVRREELGDDHWWTGQSSYALGVALAQLRLFDEARPYYDAAYSIWRDSVGFDHPHTATFLHAYAVFLANVHEVDAARAVIRQAAEARRDLVSRQLPWLTEPDAFGLLAGIAYQLSIEVSLADAWDDADLKSTALEHVLEWKSQVHRALLRARTRLGESADPVQRRLVAQLRDVQSEMSRLLSSGPDGLRDDATTPLRSLLDRRRGLERQIRTSLPADDEPVAADLDRLVASLPPRSAFVCIFATDGFVPLEWQGRAMKGPVAYPEQYLAWVARAGEDTIHTVNCGMVKEVDYAIRAYLERAFEAGARGGPVAGARRADGDDLPLDLLEMVWEPLAPHVSGADLVIISPDGLLGSVPFGIIRQADHRYLIEDHSFVYVPDPQVLLRPRAAPTRARASLLAVGGVDYGHAGSAVDAEPAAAGSRAGEVATLAARAAGRRPPDGAWSDLPGTDREVRRVVRLHEGSFGSGHRMVLTGDAATEAGCKQAMGGADVLHFATHGYFLDEDVPSLWHSARERGQAASDPWGTSIAGLVGHHPGLLSGLVLAGVNAGPVTAGEDGYLTAEEVAWQDLSAARLVVLSACNTGLGVARGGEGLLGLRRAFLSAGAATVVSSIWAVPDDATDRLMETFYTRLWVEGRDAHDALRAAQLEMLAANRAAYGLADPVTWGAFVLDGDWR